MRYSERDAGLHSNRFLCLTAALHKGEEEDFRRLPLRIGLRYDPQRDLGGGRSGWNALSGEGEPEI